MAQSSSAEQKKVLKRFRKVKKRFDEVMANSHHPLWNDPAGYDRLLDEYFGFFDLDLDTVCLLADRCRK